MAPTLMMAEPSTTQAFRPKRSFTYGTKGTAMTAPMENAAVMTPSKAPVGLLKSANMLAGQTLLEKRYAYNPPTAAQPGVHSGHSHRTRTSFRHQEQPGRGRSIAGEDSSFYTMVSYLGQASVRSPTLLRHRWRPRRGLLLPSTFWLGVASAKLSKIHGPNGEIRAP